MPTLEKTINLLQDMPGHKFEAVKKPDYYILSPYAISSRTKEKKAIQTQEILKTA